MAAWVDGVAITGEAVDGPLLLRHHELEQARYRSRLDRVVALARQRLGPEIEPGSDEWKRRVRIGLEPPVAPRLEIPVGDQPFRGAVEAPITIVEFIDYQSLQSRRLEPVLLLVLETFPELVRLQLRDFPMPFHRDARPAAHAVRCAFEESQSWDYHDRVVLGRVDLDEQGLEALAAQTQMDRSSFAECTNSGRHAIRIDQDLDLANGLGVLRAPSVFVNGIYVYGTPDLRTLVALVRTELVRLGIETQEQGQAPELDRTGDVEFAGSEGGVASTESAKPLPPIPPERLAEPESIVVLSRREVDEALLNRKPLERKLVASPGEFSGQRLLKLARVDRDDFYARLGLEQGDVLLAMNGAFLTVEHNSLWETFAAQDEITLLVMRRGLPRTLGYRIR